MSRGLEIVARVKDFILAVPARLSGSRSSSSSSTRNTMVLASGRPRTCGPSNPSPCQHGASSGPAERASAHSAMPAAMLDARLRFEVKAFDVRGASATVRSDQDHLAKVIEYGFNGVDSFNAAIRAMLTRALDVESLGLASVRPSRGSRLPSRSSFAARSILANVIGTKVPGSARGNSSAASSLRVTPVHSSSCVSGRQTPVNSGAL